METVKKAKANTWIKENYPNGAVTTIGKTFYVEWECVLEMMILFAEYTKQPAKQPTKP